MRRVLLTGATGFIGRHCLPMLLERGYEVHAVSSKPHKEQSSGIYWHQIDLLHAGQVGELVSKVTPTHLLHLAWYTVPGEYWNSLENVRWVQASLGLLHSFAEHGGQRVVMAGTCAEYDWKYGYCSEEVTPLLPATLYGTCKHSLQTMLDAFSRQVGLRSAWGRIFFLYGPGEHPDRLVSSVVLSLLQGKQARCSHGNQIRDFLYVQDVADAFIALLESDVVGPVNIGSGCPLALKIIIYKIADKIGCRDLVRLGEALISENDPPLLLADVRRLSSEVGWRKKYGLDVGLERTIDWWKSH